MINRQDLRAIGDITQKQCTCEPNTTNFGNLCPACKVWAAITAHQGQTTRRDWKRVPWVRRYN